MKNRFTREEREQERTEDALASGGDEGRGKLRKGSGNCKQVMIRACPNGATRLDEDQSRREPSEPGELKHLSTRRRRKKDRYPE